MRKGFDNGFLDLNGQYIAINLGADCCTEHECGIKEILVAFNVNTKSIGLERCATKDVPKLFTWERIGEFEGMVLRRYEDGNILCLGSGFGEGLFTAWDDRTFSVLSDEPKKIKKIREVYEAILNKDGVIWLGGGGVFQNAGLIVGIASRIPKSIIEEWEKADLDKLALKKEFEDSGIKEELAAAGCKYFALTPDRDAKGKMIIWLNPFEQDRFNYGWFTLSDLRDWAKGKGRVIKK